MALIKRSSKNSLVYIRLHFAIVLTGERVYSEPKTNTVCMKLWTGAKGTEPNELTVNAVRRNVNEN